MPTLDQIQRAAVPTIICLRPTQSLTVVHWWINCSYGYPRVFIPCFSLTQLKQDTRPSYTPAPERSYRSTADTTLAFPFLSPSQRTRAEKKKKGRGRYHCPQQPLLTKTPRNTLRSAKLNRVPECLAGWVARGSAFEVVFL
ncbi:hypothetical protein BJX76DRAFT_188790 [Aspergillus varians]